MRLAAGAILSLAFAQPASANAEADAWIRKCVAYHQDFQQVAEVLAIYCSCLSQKLSGDEAQPIAAFEKAHPDEQKACARDSGLKG